jgi:hypothetical protein
VAGAAAPTLAAWRVCSVRLAFPADLVAGAASGRGGALAALAAHAHVELGRLLAAAGLTPPPRAAGRSDKPASPATPAPGDGAGGDFRSTFGGGVGDTSLDAVLERMVNAAELHRGGGGLGPDPVTAPRDHGPDNGPVHGPGAPPFGSSRRATSPPPSRSGRVGGMLGSMARRESGLPMANAFLEFAFGAVAAEGLVPGGRRAIER